VVRFVPVFFSYSFKASSKIALKVEESVVVEIIEDIAIVGSSLFVKKGLKE